LLEGRNWGKKKTARRHGTRKRKQSAGVRGKEKGGKGIHAKGKKTAQKRLDAWRIDRRRKNGGNQILTGEKGRMWGGPEGSRKTKTH